MSLVSTSTVLSHWNYMVPGMTESSNEFYGAVDRAIAAQHLEGVKVERVNIAEGGLLSAKREYLQVRRKDHVFHICAAPFGSGFFVSWWLGEVRSGLFAALADLPYVGRLFAILASFAKPLTYYRIDTALMFQSLTHGAVLAALESAVNAKGMRSLTDVEKKPIMRDFFAQLSGAG